MGSNEYRTVINLTMQFIFLLIIVFLLIVPVTEKVKSVTDRYVNSIPDKMPVVHLKNSGLFFKGRLPYRFEFPNGSAILFRLKAQSHLKQENPFSLLLTPDTLFIKVSQTEIIDISLSGLKVDKPGTIDGNSFRHLVNKVTSAGITIAILFSLLFFIMCYNVIAIIGAGLASSLNTIFRGVLSFNNLIFSSSCFLFSWFIVFMGFERYGTSFRTAIPTLFIGYITTYLLFTAFMARRCRKRYMYTKQR